jgi:hypothetical protein
MTRRGLLAIALVAALALGAAGLRAATGQDRVKIRAAALTLPVFNPIIVNLMKEQGIDARAAIIYTP